jgi:hypothetical protein
MMSWRRYWPGREAILKKPCTRNAMLAFSVRYCTLRYWLHCNICYAINKATTAAGTRTSMFCACVLTAIGLGLYGCSNIEQCGRTCSIGGGHRDWLG